MYYCRDNNVDYYKYSSLNFRLVHTIRGISVWRTVFETLSYLFSTTLLALFLIIGYLYISKQEHILFAQMEYLTSYDSTPQAIRYPTYMVKSGQILLEKQDIARIDKILMDCDDNKTTKTTFVKEENNVRTITVKKGDTIYTLAEKAYGNASYYSLIFDANPKILKSRRDLKIGQVLRVPFF